MPIKIFNLRHMTLFSLSYRITKKKNFPKKFQHFFRFHKILYIEIVYNNFQGCGTTFNFDSIFSYVLVRTGVVKADGKQIERTVDGALDPWSCFIFDSGCISLHSGQLTNLQTFKCVARWSFLLNTFPQM